MSSDVTSVKCEFLVSEDEKQPRFSVYLTDVPLLPQSSVNAPLIPATVDGPRRELWGFWCFKREFGLISRYWRVVLWAKDGSAQPVRKKCCFCSDHSSFQTLLLPIMYSRVLVIKFWNRLRCHGNRAFKLRVAFSVGLFVESICTHARFIASPQTRRPLLSSMSPPNCSSSPVVPSPSGIKNSLPCLSFCFLSFKDIRFVPLVSLLYFFVEFL